MTPHETLGISPTASLKEIKHAYHKGALRYHPDNFPESPVIAEKKFRELARAYKAALRAHIPEFEEDDATRPFSPADFARVDTQWHRDRTNNHYASGEVTQWTMEDSTKSRSVATVNENKVFVLAWAAATILGVSIVISVVLGGLVGNLEDGMDISDILAGELTAIVVVALAITGAIYGITLTRKTILLTLQLGVRLLPFLPKPRKRKLLAQEAKSEF